MRTAKENSVEILKWLLNCSQKEGQVMATHWFSDDFHLGYPKSVREGVKKNQLFLGKSPKLWVGGGQES